MYQSLLLDFISPQVVVSHFHIKEGDTVADFGAGSGAFLSPLSKRVGQSGRVYACEIQKVLIEKIAHEVGKSHLRNIHPIRCDIEKSNGVPIQANSIDVGLLSNTLFQISAKEIAILEIGRLIRSGGRLIIIDWSDTKSPFGPKSEAILLLESAVALIESNGFVFEQVFPAGSHHYGITCRKI